MSKIITICQQPCMERYTSWWFDELCKFEDLFVLGDNKVGTIDRSKPYNYFANLEESIHYEMYQINRLMQLNEAEKLFITDLDFPGIAIQSVPLVRLKFPNIKVKTVHLQKYTNLVLHRGRN